MAKNPEETLVDLKLVPRRLRTHLNILQSECIGIIGREFYQGCKNGEASGVDCSYAKGGLFMRHQSTSREECIHELRRESVRTGGEDERDSEKVSASNAK